MIIKNNEYEQNQMPPALTPYDFAATLVEIGTALKTEDPRNLIHLLWDYEVADQKLFDAVESLVAFVRRDRSAAGGFPEGFRGPKSEPDWPKVDAAEFTLVIDFEWPEDSARSIELVLKADEHVIFRRKAGIDLRRQIADACREMRPIYRGRVRGVKIGDGGHLTAEVITGRTLHGMRKVFAPLHRDFMRARQERRKKSEDGEEQ